MAQNSKPGIGKYVIITPVRDESPYVRRTIESIVRQSIAPVEWVIVDDGSTDSTSEILIEFAAKYPWIRVFNAPDRGFRHPGPGVIQAFYFGYERLQSSEWEFIVKLDGDLVIEQNYFQHCLEEFRDDQKLGIAGGMLYYQAKGRLKPEHERLSHVRGPTKIYRRQCWDAIGGLLETLGWDTIDEVKANMLGWRTRTLPDLKVLHLRPTGAEYHSWRNAVKNGQAFYFVGYHPLFMALKFIKRIFEKPYIIYALGQCYGFISAFLRRIPQVGDLALIHYVRKQQMRRLFLRESIWK